jgi:hypothetical protein
MDYICAKWCKNRNAPIDLIGHSRGGYVVIEVARKLKTKGCCCFDTGTTYRPIAVRFLGLYDPVDMAPGYGDAETIPDNVRHVAIVFASAGPHMARSRPQWNRADHGAEGRSTDYYVVRLPGSHAALGGAPWSGDKPDGLTESEDIHMAMAADSVIRARAGDAGVSVPQLYTKDYGYRLGGPHYDHQASVADR